MLPPRTRQKFWPFPPPTMSLVLNLPPLSASSLPLLAAHTATMCLSAGITFTDSFTHFPQKSAAPSVLRAKPRQSHPSQGEAEIPARSPVAKGREASLACASAGALHSGARPSGPQDALQVRPLPDSLSLPGGSGLEKCCFGVLAPEVSLGRAPRLQKDLKRSPQP